MPRRIGAFARRPAVAMAAGTAASRGTGLLRTVALATAFGVGTTSDAYNIANTAPNMLFALVAGGMVGSMLVPMLVRDTDDAARRETASVLLGTITAWTAVVAVATAFVAPWLIQLLTAGAGDRGDVGRLLHLGESWLRWFAPQIALYGISVVATGIMTARNRLALGASAPVATNVLTIAAAVLFVAMSDSGAEIRTSQVAVMGAGTTIAVAAMAALQLWGAARCEPGLRFSPRLRHRAVTELRAIAGWMVLYVVVNQMALAVVISMASRAAGAVTAYQWAFMLMQLPYAVVAVSIFSSAYPTMARAASRSSDLTPHLAGPGLRALSLLLPAAVGLAGVSGPLASVVVGPEEAPLVAAAIRGFALSLVPFAIFQLLTRAHYVRSDTRTPALVNVAVNATMLAVDAAVLTLADSPTSLVLGLALGHAASYVVGCVLLLTRLSAANALRVSSFADRNLGRYVAGSAVLGLLLWLLPDLDGGSRWTAMLALVLLAAAGACVYGLIAGRALWQQIRPAPSSGPPA